MSRLLALALTMAAAQQLPLFRLQVPPLTTEEVFTGIVREVTDGDSLLVREAQQNIRIHLDGVDAPELAQPSGAEAKAFLNDFVQGQSVTVHLRRRGRGGEEGLARVITRGVDLSAELLRRGMAWYCPRQVDDAELVAAERSAREAKKGLWSAPGPTPPWRHRGTEGCGQERPAGSG
jgi:endonuclease YncB( thermonuclease family)